MSYHTLADILADRDIPEEELIQLTDDAQLNEIDESIYEAATARADSLIDGYLTGGGYTVPLSSVPTIVKTLSKEITIYILTKRRLRANMPESVESTYKAQIKLLEGIQAGKVSIGVAKAESASGGGSGAYRTNKTSDDKTFPADVLDQY